VVPFDPLYHAGGSDTAVERNVVRAAEVSVVQTVRALRAVGNPADTLGSDPPSSLQFTADVQAAGTLRLRCPSLLSNKGTADTPFPPADNNRQAPGAWWHKSRRF
jgi:hypothetical protein